MTVLKYTIKPISPWITPLRSDTLHGLIACQVREWEGEAACLEFIKQYSDNPPFICSSAFPHNFLPHPVLPPISRQRFKQLYSNNKDNALFDALQEYKKYKKRAFIPLHIFEALQNNLSSEAVFSAFNGSPWKLESSKIGIEPHNTINRLSNTTLEGGLYFHQLSWHDNSFDIYVQAKDHAMFTKYLNIIGDIGFGADSTLGKGCFTVAENPQDVTNMFTKKGTHYFSLSVFATEDMQNLQGYYKLFTKKGRTWIGKSDKSPFKKPFLALEEGAILSTLPTGGTLSKIHPDNSVVQICHMLALPCTLLTVR